MKYAATLREKLKGVRAHIANTKRMQARLEAQFAKLEGLRARAKLLRAKKKKSH
jgi:hypothetical protein